MELEKNFKIIRPFRTKLQFYKFSLRWVISSFIIGIGLGPISWSTTRNDGVQIIAVHSTTNWVNANYDIENWGAETHLPTIPYCRVDMIYALIKQEALSVNGLIFELTTMLINLWRRMTVLSFARLRLFSRNIERLICLTSEVRKRRKRKFSIFYNSQDFSFISEAQFRHDHHPATKGTAGFSKIQFLVN